MFNFEYILILMHFPEWGSCYDSGTGKYETSPSSENIEEAVCTCMHTDAD